MFGFVGGAILIALAAGEEHARRKYNRYFIEQGYNRERQIELENMIGTKEFDDLLGRHYERPTYLDYRKSWENGVGKDLAAIGEIAEKEGWKVYDPLINGDDEEEIKLARAYAKYGKLFED